MSAYRLSSAQIARYHESGYLIVDRLFDSEEIDLLIKISRADRELADSAFVRSDGEGITNKVALRNDLQENIYSAFVRSPRLINPMEQLLDDEVYHWHHKMILKEPRVGGAFEWHQDFGYWYDRNYCLYPTMASCMIAADRTTKANGCLQVIEGSHHIGRIDHLEVGDQAGADPLRVEAALERHPLIHVELEPGSAVFFHCNLLHRSDKNTSDDPRWTLICCYNTAKNDPFRDSQHPRYTPLEKSTDTRIKEIGREHWAAIESELSRDSAG